MTTNVEKGEVVSSIALTTRKHDLEIPLGSPCHILNSVTTIAVEGDLHVPLGSVLRYKVSLKE